MSSRPNRRPLSHALWGMRFAYSSRTMRRYSSRSRWLSTSRFARERPPIRKVSNGPAPMGSPRRAWNPPVGGGVKLRPRKRVAPAGSFAERHGSVGHSGIRGASLAPVRPLAFRSRWGRTRHDVLRKNARPGMLRGKVRGEPAGRGRRPPGYSTVGTVPHGERFTDRRARQLVFDRSQGSTRR
jgi:hypothetical protein